MLSNCVTDFDNPLSREWALICVRNACEDNELNQKFINDLNLVGVIQDEVLSQQGIRVDINPLEGKLNFVKE